MDVSLRERNGETGGFETLLDLLKHIEPQAPIIVRMTVGTDEQIDRRFTKLLDHH